MKRERRLLIGKQLREGPLSAPGCMKKCGVGYTCACNWRGGYEESAGLERPRKGKPIEVPEGAPAPSGYEAMGKDEPIVEPMRREMEAARLRKGCSVKGVAQRRDASLPPARMPSDRGTVLEMADPGAMQGDARRLPHRRRRGRPRRGRGLCQVLQRRTPHVLLGIHDAEAIQGSLLETRPASTSAVSMSPFAHRGVSKTELNGYE